jgi:hypothetical protein
MSIEYVAKFQKEVNLETSNQLLYKCSVYDGWQVLTHKSDRISFKLKDIPTRENWNEDVEIAISGNAFYVIFHSASRSQREDCISHLNGCLKIFDSSSHLEEI